jgi:hypothetical protein
MPPSLSPRRCTVRTCKSVCVCGCAPYLQKSADSPSGLKLLGPGCVSTHCFLNCESDSPHNYTSNQKPKPTMELVTWTLSAIDYIFSTSRLGPKTSTSPLALPKRQHYQLQESRSTTTLSQDKRRVNLYQLTEHGLSFLPTQTHPACVCVVRSRVHVCASKYTNPTINRNE